jgi:CheY-like chemotaxis protein
MKSNGSDSKGIDVLLVEDSPGDVRLTQEAFREANGSIKLDVAVEGVEAMAFLKCEGGHAHAPRPDIILLDLNLPKMDGHEVLAHIKADGELKTIPTVILTTFGSGCSEKLSAAGKLLPQKTRGVGRLREPREEHQ